MVEKLKTVNVDSYKKDFFNIKEVFAKVVVGQEDILKKMLISLLCKGHILLEGVPGIAKSLMVKTLAEISGCQFKRIQFTPDLLPSDITGVVTYDEVTKFYIVKGPIFSNFVLADEINRASPKVQSALLEGMQERQVTIGKETYPLPNPFFVIATQNPLESLGVYTLPEAQLDRFLFKILVKYPKKSEEEIILHKNTSIRDFESYKINSVIDAKKIISMQEELENVFISPTIRKYIIAIIDATRNPGEYGIKKGKYIDLGASPRGSIGLFIASKAHALISNRGYVTPHDIKNVAMDILRHRIILSYEAQTENVNTEDIIKEILHKIPVP